MNAYTNNFTYKDNEFFCDEKSIFEITKDIKTPFYLYSKSALESYFNLINSSIEIDNKLVCFAVKALPTLQIIKTFANLHAGADCVSGGEVFRALKAGVKGEKIVFSGAAKTDEDLIFAIRNEILQINVESFSEIAKINEIAKNLGKKQKISIRIRPNIKVSTHKNISTGDDESKFGIDAGQITIEKISEIKQLSNIDLIGLSMHIGSQVFSVSEFKEGFDVMKSCLEVLKSCEIEIKTVDLGGGFGVKYQNTDGVFDFFEYTKMIKNVFASEIKIGVKFIFEPGRFLVANAGVLVSKVLCIKEDGDRKFAILDAGMNDLMRVALYESWHDILPIKIENKDEAEYDFCGTVCESTDFFARNRKIFKLKEGDLVAIMSAGAYGSSMSSEYNSRPLISQYFLANNILHLIKKERTWHDLIKEDILL